jgi:antitoxin MazE2
MTMLSFRVDDAEAAAAQECADALGIHRSELLRDALHRHLAALRAEREIDSWVATPLTDAERSLMQVADWGPAEDWADWTDAAR